jgi:hypothetical protein
MLPFDRGMYRFDLEVESEISLRVYGIPCLSQSRELG